ncbi:uncharacterized protein BT62DRAFT_919078 [Guyanagaster necrorhizus]|uniref:Uncharacterized protein n=1 Tax=Guyanagaster necrorhizus TaxID=856835 RepID=A0A9P7VTG3_9AGAR|nr:uncharacterized protein BT62DRAFT_919078 [Guyanagaster necrorhizus MCA 3950]KAG7447103.1 hypothetical protein BT62DRAFT_919078 [Guyanagaster necrorhizus MCA 3950]
MSYSEVLRDSVNLRAFRTFTPQNLRGTIYSGLDLESSLFTESRGYFVALTVRYKTRKHYEVNVQNLVMSQAKREVRNVKWLIDTMSKFSRLFGPCHLGSWHRTIRPLSGIEDDANRRNEGVFTRLHIDTGQPTGTKSMQWKRRGVNTSKLNVEPLTGTCWYLALLPLLARFIEIPY